jgi:two-component system response regulator AtoC
VAAVTILVVDDEAGVRRTLAALVEDEGWRAVEADGFDAAAAAIARAAPDVILTDLKMPDRDGLALLAHCRSAIPRVPVILLTAHGTVDTAVDAMKRGAFDFLLKPFDRDQLAQVVAKAIQVRRADDERPSAYFEEGGPALIGEDPKIEGIRRAIAKVAGAASNVLIVGETGTGKEIVAKAIHLAGPRRSRPFIAVNCAAIPETLLESELFGHEKGSFTGAVAARPGRFELADGGTLFLDEVGDAAPPLQARLLRALQERAFERVGGVKTIRVDVRVIAATNRDLAAEVKAGRFREDLYYRLNVVPIAVPPLRERRGDIPPLVRHLADKAAAANGRRAPRFTEEAMAKLAAAPWPGNVRELENAVERAVVMCEGGVVRDDDIPGSAPPSASAAGLKFAVESSAQAVERRMIEEALDRAGQNRTRAAKLLGISRRTLQKKLKEWGMQSEEVAG